MATGQQQLKCTSGHSTAVFENRLYCWGGDNADLPKIHDSDAKRKITSSIDVFCLHELKWERMSTTGTPPAGARKYASTMIGNKIFYFGGNCIRQACFHNDLFELSINTPPELPHNWRKLEVITSCDNNLPMSKIACGMISFNHDGKNIFLVVGGLGKDPDFPQRYSQYISSPEIPGHSYTNETHILCVSPSPGQWKTPKMTGDRPIPCAYFTLNTLPDGRGIMFGGTSINTINEKTRINDVFLLNQNLSQDEITFQKVKQSSNWPKGRSAHASAIITTDKKMAHLVVLGGLGDGFLPMKECWILKLSNLHWYQISVPDSVTERFSHSMSIYYPSTSKQYVWIIVTGGNKKYNHSTKHGTPVTGSDMNVIMELVYSDDDDDDEWLLNRVWDNEKNWYKAREIIIREKEAEKWSIKMQDKDKKLSSLNEQLEMERKGSLMKSQEVEVLKKQIMDLKGTSTHSPDKEDMKTQEKQQRIEEEKLKPVNEEAPKSDTTSKIHIKYEGWKINFIHLIILFIAVGFFSLTWLYWNFQDGMQLVGEEHFTITGDREYTLDWLEFGLHIDVPKGAIPAGHTSDLHVKAIIAGNFKLPDDCYLVSGIYQITTSKQFKKKVTLHLQHAAVIKSEEEASYFRFYSADSSNGPPYEFKEMNGGSFNPLSNSSTIDLQHFSCHAVGANKSVNQQFLSQIFYKSNSAKEWDMKFTITKNDPVFVKHVQQCYHEYYAYDNFPVKLQENATHLQLNAGSHSSSWDVIEVISPMIERDVIECFNPNETYHIPHCTYLFVWQSKSPPRLLALEFKLIGADGDKKFTLVVPRYIQDKEPDTETDGTGGVIPNDESLLVHLDDITEVNAFCEYLKLPSEYCDGIHKENPTNLLNQKVALLRAWRNRSERTWKEFIRAFVLLKKCAKAKKLADTHSVFFNKNLIDDKEVLERCEDINS